MKNRKWDDTTWIAFEFNRSSMTNIWYVRTKFTSNRYRWNTFIFQDNINSTIYQWARIRTEDYKWTWKIFSLKYRYRHSLGKHRGGCFGNHCPNWHVNFPGWLFSIRYPGKHRYRAIVPCFVEWKIVRPSAIVGGCSLHDRGIHCAWCDNLPSSKHSTFPGSMIGW